MPTTAKRFEKEISWFDFIKTADNSMEKIILILLISFLTQNLFGQKIEENFIQNFKTSKWKSLENFNDSTILQLKELKLVRWNPNRDTLTNNPVVWIFNDEFKIKYYFNVKSSTQRSFNTLNCKYTYDDRKGIITLILANKDKSILKYETAIISTGSFILLSRTKKK